MRASAVEVAEFEQQKRQVCCSPLCLSPFTAPVITAAIRQLVTGRCFMAAQHVVSAHVKLHLSAAGKSSSLRTPAWVPVQARIDAVKVTAGFSAVLELLRASGKPAVGHNLGFDLAFTLEHLAQPLPEAWADYKALAASWLPGVGCPGVT